MERSKSQMREGAEAACSDQGPPEAPKTIKAGGHNKPRRHQYKSMRYKWNVSLLMVGDKLTSFIAFVSFRNVNIFRRHYLLESAAALAADVAKAISQGYACQDRLNFPGRFYNDIPIDVHKAVASISEDLVSTGESPHTSASLAKDVICQSKFLSKVHTVLRDVTESICEYTSNKSVVRSHCVEVQNRMMEAQTYIDAALSTPLQNGESFNAHSLAQLKARPNRIVLGGGCSQEFVAKLPVPRKLYFDKNIQSPKDIIPGDCVTPQSHKVSGVPTTTHRNSRLVACCHDTLCFVYLRQEGLYRIMNLEKTMRAKGVVGFCHELRGWNSELLKGSMVVVERADSFRLRRISSWNMDTMDVNLEDGTTVSPFELSDRVLEDGESQLDYLIREYNHRIISRQVKPLEAVQVIEVFYTLLCAARAFHKLPFSLKSTDLIRSLAQKLAEGPTVDFMKIFDQYLDTHDELQARKKAKEYMLFKKALGSSLPIHIGQWMGRDSSDTEPDIIDIEDDVKSYEEQLRSSRDALSEHSTQEHDEKSGSQCKHHESACDDAYAKFSSADDFAASEPVRGVSKLSASTDGCGAREAANEIVLLIPERPTNSTNLFKRKSSGSGPQASLKEAKFNRTDDADNTIVLT